MVWPSPLDHRPLDFAVAPVANSGLAVRGNIGRRDGETWCVEPQTATGESQLRYGLAGCILWGVTISTGHNRVHEVIAALDKGFGRYASGRSVKNGKTCE
jgi:hypothetical protein